MPRTKPLKAQGRKPSGKCLVLDYSHPHRRARVVRALTLQFGRVSCPAPADRLCEFRLSCVRDEIVR